MHLASFKVATAGFVHWFRKPFITGSLAMVVLLSGCTARVTQDGPPSSERDVVNVPGLTPKVEPRSKYGNPKSYVVRGKRYYVKDSSHGFVQRGIASWYGEKFHGRRTSSGETYDMHGISAAHKTLPLPTYVEVRNLENGRSLVLRVNDRGPFHKNRIIDLSYTAAKKLGIVKKGTGYVEVRALDARAPAPTTGSADAALAPKPTRVSMYLQVGAFAVQDNAQRVHEQLQSLLGPISRIETTQQAGRPLYRVRLGPLKDVGHADQLAEHLASIGLNSPRIILE